MGGKEPERHGRRHDPLEAFRPFPYMPGDAAVVTDYDELAEILRSPKMRPEPPVDNDAVIGGTLSKLFGRDHTDRRRILNRLVKPDALEHIWIGC